MDFLVLLGRIIILVAGIVVGNSNLPLIRLDYQNVRNDRRVFYRFLILFLINRLYYEFAERYGFYRGVTPNQNKNIYLDKNPLENIIYRNQSVQKFLDQMRFGDNKKYIKLAKIVINFFKLFRIFINVLSVYQPYIIELAVELVRHFYFKKSVVSFQNNYYRSDFYQPVNQVLGVRIIIIFDNYIYPHLSICPVKGGRIKG